jgi:hypothetical protein
MVIETPPVPTSSLRPNIGHPRIPPARGSTPVVE